MNAPCIRVGIRQGSALSGVWKSAVFARSGLSIVRTLGVNGATWRRLGVVPGCLVLLAAAFDSSATVIAPGTELEVRLSTPIGSRTSHAGDPLEATVIAPVLGPNGPMLLQGATVSGMVENIEPLGLGFKHAAAEIGLRFDSLKLPGGRVVPIRGRVREIETARERVDDQGYIHGIHPTANLSSCLSLLTSALLVDTEFVLPALAVKFLVVRAPDSEIYLPAGTELFLEVAGEFVIPETRPIEETPPPLTSGDIEEAQHLLEALPGQQTSRGDKHASDLINVLVLGSSDQINAAFQAAGWTGENKRSVLALYRMYHSLVQRMGYSMAPMSTLTLNGVAQSRVYQKSLDTLARRHHIRLWEQRNSDVWLGAASEDVRLTVRGMHITHAIDSQIDDERAKVVNDLWFTGCVGSASLLSRESLKPIGEKGFSISTDGDIAVLRMNSCREPRMVPKAFSASHGDSRIKQAFTAVTNDIARANPLTLASITFRSARASNHRKTNMAVPLQAQGWRRPSVIESLPEDVREPKVAESKAGYEARERASAGH